MEVLMQQLDKQLQNLYTLLKDSIPCDDFIIKNSWSIQIINIDEAFWKKMKSHTQCMAKAFNCNLCEDGWKDGEQVIIFSGQ